MKSSGNTILITGGATGIGSVLAAEFMKLGNTVIACGRRKNRLEELAASCPGVHTKVCDVSSADERTMLAEWVYANFPETNVLINNAGVQKSINFDDPMDTNRRASEETEINFIAPVHLSSLFIPLLSNKKESAIINITSGLAFAPLAMYPVYCATKAALHSFSMSLRYRLRDTSIKVFEMAPPLVQTELKVPADNGFPEMNAHGIPVQTFVDEAMAAFKDDVLEIAVGQAANMREKRDAMFPVMNPPKK